VTPPVFVNCRDRLACLEALLAWLEGAGCDEIYLIDNDSRYEPLLAFYERCPHEVVYLGRNVGRFSMFVVEELQTRVSGRSFVYTDPDIVPVAECPPEALLHWADLLERYPDVSKVGPGLKIDDIPMCYGYRRRARRWEKKWWKDEVEPGVFRAFIDTTFALHRAGTTDFSFDALRTGHPYVARHLAWYADSKNPTAEEQFYNRRVSRDTPDSPSTTFWSGESLHPQLMRETSFRGRIDLRGRLRSALKR
jgi:hypothetical protein